MRALAVVILVVGFILGSWATATAETGVPAERSAKVTADRLNLRGSPSTTAEKVGSLVRDEAVTILEEQGEWYRLRLEGGQTGWAARKFIEVVAEAPTETPEASETATPEPSDDGARKAVMPRAKKQGGGGGSLIGSVLKWGCFLGAGACGYLAYDEHSQGNDSYDRYKTEYEAEYQAQYNWLTLNPLTEDTARDRAHTEALAKTEYLRANAEDHDQYSQTFAYAAGGLGAAFLVQQLFFGKHHDQAAVETARPATEPRLACGIRQGQLRAAVTLARF
jgi:SH3-like domain-containing protein